MRFSDDRVGERHERSNGRSVGRKQVIQAATWVGAFAAAAGCEVNGVGMRGERVGALIKMGGWEAECSVVRGQ